MPDIKTIADKADVIINGYAFTRNQDRIQVLNLNSPDKAVVFNADGQVLETTMDDIELSIASRYLQQNLTSSIISIYNALHLLLGITNPNTRSSRITNPAERGLRKM